MIKKVTGMLKNKIVLAFLFTIFLGKSVVANADYNKGLIAYYNGDYETVLAEMMPLAEQGDAAAQHYLALMYDFGKGLPENDEIAVKWYTKAAEQGVVRAYFRLGFMYGNGHGVPQNDRTAVLWYIKAAELGDADAQYNLALKYRKGEGVPQNDKIAVKWYKEAAEQEIAEAQTNLGYMYANGYGVLTCLLYTSPSPRDLSTSRMPSSA